MFNLNQQQVFFSRVIMDCTTIPSADEARDITRRVIQAAMEAAMEEQEERKRLLGQLDTTSVLELIASSITKAAKDEETKVEVRFPDTFQVGDWDIYQTVGAWYEDFLQDHLSQLGYTSRLIGDAIGYEDTLELTW